jgi:hypothetical protein
MNKSSRSYAEDVKKAELMSAGIENNKDQAARRGMDDAFATSLKTNRQMAIALNNEQEKLKADLKRKTEELRMLMSTLNAAVAEARKIVKVEFPKEQWVEFGIDARR